MTHSTDVPAERAETVKDPVCGMTIPVAGDTRSASWRGQTYFFCSQDCLDKFQREPAKYAVTPDDSARREQAAPAGVEYTCPMHPAIVRTAPGSCPICGMALEPRTPGADQENAELREMTRRFWIAAVLTIPLVALVMLPERVWSGLIPSAAQLWLS